MFKIWSFFILSVILIILLVVFFHINSFFFFFIYSELVWVCMFFLEITISSYLNDPRLLVIGLIVLLIAAVEIILVGFYLNLQELIIKS